MSYLACYENMLLSGCDDWVDVSEVSGIAKVCGMATTNERWREVVISLVQQVLNEGLMEIGDINGPRTPESPNGFLKWPLSPADALDKVRQGWKEGEFPPGISEIGWLQSTPRGLAKGRAIGDLWHYPREPLDTLIMQAERYGCVDCDDVTSIARRPFTGWLGVPAAAAELVRAAVSAGLMECGDYSSGRFKPWRASLDESVGRFKLLNTKVGVHYNEFCMENTTKGRIKAVSLLADWFNTHPLPS